MPLRATAMPGHVNTLVDLLVQDAASAGEQELFRFCASPEVAPMSWTRASLDQAARAWAIRIRERVPPEAPVLVLAGFGKSFCLGFLACLYAGRIAVPALCPDGARSTFSISRLRHIVQDAQPGLVLSDAALPDTVFERVPGLASLPHIALGEDSPELQRKLEGLATTWRRPEGLRERIAFIQYTSGSTREPRGVVVRHDNLFEHQARAHRVFENPPGATTVSWLPLHHDMGLIGAMLYPLFSQGRGVFLPPTSFLRRPMWWLQMISETGARSSTAPNFAYEVCTKRAKDEEVAALDLSAWQFSVCGAEPVRAQTMRAFCERFGPAGFRAKTFLPCFGLAEATLVGSASRVADDPKVYHFEIDALRRGKLRSCEPGPAVATGESADARVESHVACGQATEGHELCIVELDAPHAELPPSQVGEIWMRGPSVAQAYWRRPNESAHHFGGTRPGVAADTHAPWMRTGDLGAMHDGQLFVFGRVADLIRMGERSWAPTVLESAIDAAPPRGVSGPAVAWVSSRHGLTLAVETRKLKDKAHAETICEDLAQCVETRIGARPRRILLLAPRTVAKTSSGKMRRYRYRETDTRGELPARVVWQADEAQGQPGCVTRFESA